MALRSSADSPVERVKDPLTGRPKEEKKKGRSLPTGNRRRSKKKKKGKEKEIN